LAATLSLAFALLLAVSAVGWLPPEVIALLALVVCAVGVLTRAWFRRGRSRRRRRGADLRKPVYTASTTLRPDWHSDELDKGRIKVVYSGTPSDVPPVSEHVRRDSANATLKARLKDVDDEMEIVIVKDMTLTGYDSPPLHTLDLDRPLKGALLMQTLARVNRTFRGKQDGLLVAYAPLADNLQKALAEYTVSDQEHRPVSRNIDEAVALTQHLVEAIREVLAGHDWREALSTGNSKGYLKAVTSATDYLRKPGDDSLAYRYRRLSGQLARGWALCSKSDDVQVLRPQIAFYEEVRMAKCDAADR